AATFFSRFPLRLPRPFLNPYWTRRILIIPTVAAINYSEGFEDQVGLFDGGCHLFRVFPRYPVVFKVLSLFLIDGGKATGEFFCFLRGFLFLSGGGFFFPAQQGLDLVRHKGDDFLYSPVYGPADLFDDILDLRHNPANSCQACQKTDSRGDGFGQGVFHVKNGFFQVAGGNLGDGVEDGIGKGDDLFGPVDEEFYGVADGDDGLDDGAHRGEHRDQFLYAFDDDGVPDPFNN